MFICPVCKERLSFDGKSFVCINHHCFDCAKEGYVNLLTRKNSADPGDTMEMVDARRRFLEKGYYASFRSKAKELVDFFTKEGDVFVDAGCGEGYYTRVLGETRTSFAYDISRNAVRRAAKADAHTLYAVAGSYAIPFETQCANLVCAIFSPIVSNEFLRILVPGGYMLLAVPTERHLFGLKELLYDDPYENTYKETIYDGFRQVDRIRVESFIQLDSSQDIQNLFAMTPYFWKSSVISSHRASQAESLKTEIGFDFLIYQKQ